LLVSRLPFDGSEPVKQLPKIGWHIHGAWKQFLSVFKPEWGLSDYPIRIWHQRPDARDAASRLKFIPWVADVWRWPAIAGKGDTKQEALDDRRESFEKFVATGEPLPRPGVRRARLVDIFDRVQASRGR
jgi:hypothetical protein